MLVIANLALVTAAGTALAIRLTSDHHGSASPEHSTPPRATAHTSAVPSAAPALVAWVRDNVPPTAPIVADGPSAAALQRIGFTASTDYANCHRDRFVLVTPSLRHRAATLPALAGCLASSQVVAAVGQGATATEMRAITADPEAAAAARRQEVADRRLGAAALTQNPAITIATGVRDQLLAGRLDLRAETVLATLARSTAFHIEAVRAEPAEADAGMPARSVALRLAHPPGAGWFQSHLSSDYRPIGIMRTGPRVEWLTWSFRVEPPPVLK